jgi:wyosine [tRNA(Phe)-imidazoG37] synthetase (radical SAM superfamily)
MSHPEDYGRLIRQTQSTYVEAKGYVYVGMSRLRLSFQNMPKHMEIKGIWNGFEQRIWLQTSRRVYTQQSNST